MWQLCLPNQRRISLAHNMECNLRWRQALGHSNIIHCFSSPARLLWRHTPPKHPTSLFMSAELVHKLYLKSRGLFTAHSVFGSLLSFGASTVYTCSMFSVLSKTMVFLSATVVQGGCRKCLLPWSLRGALRWNAGSVVLLWSFAKNPVREWLLS